MSYFGDKLKALMELNSVNGMDIQRATGINCSQVSRWHSGDQIMVSEEAMAHLCQTVARTKYERAELIAAHLRDECFGPGADLVQITIVGADQIAKASPPHQTKDERMFAYLRKVCIEKPLIRKVLLNLASNEGFK